MNKKAAGLTAAAALLLAACGNENDENIAEGSGGENNGEDTLHVTASFSVIADFVEQVGGEHVTVDYIVPRGEEPEEHEPTPGNFQNVADSEAFFVNGFGLESWLQTLMDNASETDAVVLSDGVEGIPLQGEDDVYDPHAWLDPQNVEIYAENIKETLSELDPDNEADYEANMEAFVDEVMELDAWMEEELAEVPENNRFVTISENALVYFGERYDFETAGIWELNSHEEGTPEQISGLIDELEERQVPYVFTESTVNPNYMETVSENSGVPIYEEMLYTDGVGDDDTGIATYLDMMEHNTEAIRSALEE
ncbi:MAG: metal ABC transporter substrate-binding protein [Alkalicoccus sp.]|uniref:Metal ABC transporter substrate-binding protein n=1 Tax=Alkalicoccus sp. TaxID=2005376 RepID=A0A651EDC1_9BACI|nr:MAG: metal ABC transporter substrate-binding protein [Alkalicoccus sp.]